MGFDDSMTLLYTLMRSSQWSKVGCFLLKRINVLKKNFYSFQSRKFPFVEDSASLLKYKVRASESWHKEAEDILLKVISYDHCFALMEKYS
jgi:hypothetical protein